MRVTKIVCLAFTTLVIGACGSKTTSESVNEPTEVAAGLASSTFKVWGNCGMCQKTIEGSLKIEGISSAHWNKDTKLITVAYNDQKMTLDQIQKAIALSGYDTELYKGDDKAYAELPDCCQYERK